MEISDVVICLVLASSLVIAGCNETRPEPSANDTKHPAQKVRLIPHYASVKPATPAKSSQPKATLHKKAQHIVEFTDRDRRIILQYYKHHTKNIRLDHASSAQLSRFKMAERQQNHLKETNLPFALERQLSQLPPGYTRKQVGHHLLIRNLNTSEIVDLIMDIAH